MAGRGLFADRGDLTSHREFAGMVLLLAVILLGGAGLGGTWFADLSDAAILIVLVIAQSLLPSQRETAPFVASLHPLVGSLLMVAAVSVTIRTTRRAIVRWRDTRAGPQDGQT